ncbi:ribosome modulation factor [Streptomyces phaeochromogenes]|uniref:Rmf/CrpP fold protein n=1 Tax=Streptomyces phaeochromogenes TaxID=1923 RepID=UPI00278DD114|nr:Rmf/CrpP fold protein [Streptomyces phaeochromogenes]MDQ0949326.1 ribosome modulation factor [Streptomyces phaeochromogenes]
MGTREDIVAAITKGREAGEAGQEPTACPYPSTSILRTAWVKGYAPARRAREKDRAD